MSSSIPQIFQRKDLQQNLELMSDDNQLSKSSSQTQPQTVILDGKENTLFIRRSFCEGVNTCNNGGCSGYFVFVSSTQKLNRRLAHHYNRSLKATGNCQPNLYKYCLSKTMREDRLVKGAVTSWSNPAGLWCQKLSKDGVRAPATAASQPGSRLD